MINFGGLILGILVATIAGVVVYLVGLQVNAARKKTAKAQPRPNSKI